MLIRETGALFRSTIGDTVQLFVEQTGNGGTETAKFQYNKVVLPRKRIMGHPGCEFTLVPGIRQFETVVVFNPASPATARYDLFQVNSAGGASALAESVEKADLSPLIGFGIRGMAAALTGSLRAGPVAGSLKGLAPLSPAPPSPVRKRPAKKRAKKRPAKRPAKRPVKRRVKRPATRPATRRPAKPAATRKQPPAARTSATTKKGSGKTRKRR